jgi:hypothetical protein
MVKVLMNISPENMQHGAVEYPSRHWENKYFMLY